jgi:purine catabolism regulator
MLPTVAEVLELEPVSRGAPRVLAGADRLDVQVRWVHVIELAEAGRLLRGGELVLSTGIALPPDPAGLRRYVADLASAGASALAVELGSRYVRSLPVPLVQAAVRHRLPLIVFERETQFIAITEAVHARILASQVAELTAADRLYQVFTDLAVAGASAQQVVTEASELAGVPVILADVGHLVLACATAGQRAQTLLAGFEGKSRALRMSGRTTYDQAAGWLVTRVGSGEGDDESGRLIFVLSGRPTPSDEVMCERAATTLTLTRMVGDWRAQRQPHEARYSAKATRSALFAQVAGPGFADWADLHARITAVGVPVTGHRLVPLAVRGTEPAVIAEACEEAGVQAISGALEEGQCGALLALAPGADQDGVLAGLLTAPGLRGRPAGTADPVPALAQARDAIREASLAAGAVFAVRAAGGLAGDDLPSLPCPKLADLGLAGLLYQLRDDARVLRFAEQRLARLLEHDEARGTDLVRVLAIYLEAGGSKAVAATRAGLARPTMYERLRQIERAAGLRLDSPLARTEYMVALLARLTRQGGAGYLAAGRTSRGV